MSMPVLSGSVVWITPATSPSVIRATDAPVLRIAAIRSAWRGRVDRDVDLGSGLAPDLLADEQHRGFVALALADHHRAVDRQLVELAPHGVDRGLVGRLLVAAPAQARSRNRGAFGHTHDLER